MNCSLAQVTKVIMKMYIGHSYWILRYKKSPRGVCTFTEAMQPEIAKSNECVTA